MGAAKEWWHLGTSQDPPAPAAPPGWAKVGWGSEQSGIVEGVPADGRVWDRVGPKVPFQPNKTLGFSKGENVPRDPRLAASVGWVAPCMGEVTQRRKRTMGEGLFLGFIPSGAIPRIPLRMKGLGWLLDAEYGNGMH